MKRFLLFFHIIFFVQSFFAQTPVYQWGKQIGGSDRDLGRSMVVDAAGNVYTAGFFNGTADFDPGPGIYNLSSPSADASTFISKLDAFGNFVWAKKIGAESGAEGITLDINGNIYITGNFDGTVDFDPGAGIFNLTSCGTSAAADGYILKLNNWGDFVWVKQIRVCNILLRPYSINTDNVGDVYITGDFRDTIDFDPGVGVYYMNAADGIFLLKLNNLGDFVWAKKMGGDVASPADAGRDLVFDSFGNVYITGYFGGAEDLDPGIGSALFTTISPKGFISKLDASGNFIWAKCFGDDLGLGSTTSLSIAIDNLNNVYTTGYFFGTEDFDPNAGIFNLTADGPSDVFILKLDSSGNFIWAKKVGGSSWDRGRSIAVDINEGVYVTGYHQDTSDFDPGAGVFNLLTPLTVGSTFYLLLNQTGDFLWAGQIDGASQAESIVVDANGSIYSTGSFNSPVDFDPGVGLSNVINFGVYDVFIHKMNQPYFGINENNYTSNFISIYPNPTSNNLTIETTKSTNISIVNLLGQELFNSKIEKSQTIDVSFLSNGIYFVKDLENGGSVKFVKQ